MSSAPVAIVVLALVVVACIVFGSWYFSEKERVKRALRGAERRPIARLREGVVARICGVVEAHGAETLSAPLSGRQCTAFDVTVEEYRSSGKSGSWHTIVHESEAIPFMVSDQSGRALVRPTLVSVALVVDESQRSGFLQDASPELNAFLARHGHSSESWVFNRTLRYREGIIEPGETVAVLGKARFEDDPSPDAAGHAYRDRPRRTVIEPPDDGPMLLSDDVTTTT